MHNETAGPQTLRPGGPAVSEQFLVWLEALVAEAPGYISVAMGPEHRIVFANQAYNRVMNGREVIGKTIREAMPELEDQGFFELIDQVYSTGESHTFTEMPVRDVWEPGSPPTVRYHSFVYIPFRGSCGNVVGMFLQGSDVTEAKLAKEEVQRLHAELVHVSRASAMSAMASTLAHELNQPLTAALNFITGSLRMIDPGDQPAIQNALQRAKSCIQHAAATIRSLRDTVNQRATATDPVPLLKLVEASAIIALSGYENIRPALHLDVAPDLSVDVDRVQIEQVFINLIRNAAEAMKNVEDRWIEIRAQAAHRFVTVTVQDNGPGLPSELLPSLFQSVASTKAGGMGIGLSICRTIIEAHGGKIWIDEEARSGARFHLSLPAAKAEQNACPQDARRLSLAGSILGR